MWNDQKRERFQMLRERTDSLSAAEQAELNALTQELESAESTYMNGATNRMRQEREVVEIQNRSLEALAARQNALIARLEGAFFDARAERNAINSELALVLAASTGSSPGRSPTCDI